MNWNEWRFRWGMFWLFVLVLIVTLVGCGHKPTNIKTIEPEYHQEPPMSDCDIAEIMGRKYNSDCENLKIA